MKTIFLLFISILLLVSCSDDKVNIDGTSEYRPKSNLVEYKCPISEINQNKFTYSSFDTLRIIEADQITSELFDSNTLELIPYKTEYESYYYHSINLEKGYFTYIVYNTDGGELILATIHNCKIVDQLSLAFQMSWEHGYKIKESVINKNGLIEVTVINANKDFGDYQTYDIDTSINYFQITNKGEIKYIEG
ncbi:MAG: hypothetical protein KF732_02585 [Flavobacteriales bacterium]|nr:hypothetical protein [Flavobacteriales bacterium]